MKKVLFTTMSIIAVAAMMFVSCKKENTKTDGDEQKQETVDPELVGTWTIVGEANGWDQTAGVAMTESDNVWTVAEVAIKGEGFKFVKDASWDVNLGAKEDGAKEDGVEFELDKPGKNIKGAKDGVYSVTLNLLTKKAKIAFVKDLEPEGPQIPEGDHTAVGTWENVEGYVEYFRYYNIAADWSNAVLNNQRALAFDGISYENGVFTFLFPDQTFARWQNQLYINPVDNFAVGLEAGKYYKMSFTLNASAAHNAFFKLEVLNKANNAENKYEGALLKEVGEIEMTAGEDVPVEFTFESTAAVENIILVFDFGFNVANETVLLKNITLEETEEPAKVLTVTESILPVASYPTQTTIVSTEDGEEFYVYNVATFPDYGGKFQMKKNGGFFANRTSFGKIESIKVTCQSDKAWYPTNLTVYAGTAEIPGETVIEGTSDATEKTGTYDFSNGDYRYFTIMNTSGYAVYLEKVEIAYKGGMQNQTITIDGNFNDWQYIAGLTSTAETPVYQVFKAYADANNLYFYSKRDNRAAIWASGGYYYYQIDNDGDSTTGETNGGADGLSGWFYIKPFAGTADAPAIATEFKGEATNLTVTNVKFAGLNGESSVELEVSIPRGDAGINPNSTIMVYSWSNKDGYDVQGKPITLKIK